MSRGTDEAEVKLIREVHGETGELIANLYEALPGVMAHHFLKYDYWTQVDLIKRFREALKNGQPSLRRPVGHITNLIGRLEKWRDVRAGLLKTAIADGERPRGKRLSNTELSESISYLEEYRELMAEGVTKKPTPVDLGASGQYDNGD